MADRPSVNDILAKARAAKAAGEAAPAAAEPAATPTPAPAQPAPTAAAPTGRPLTLKEKLAAAKANAAPAAAAPASAAPAAAAAPAQPAAPAVKVPTAAELGRPLTLKEKMAAAKAAGAGGGAAQPAAAAAAPAAAKPAAAARELPPLSEMKDPRDLADALRQTAAKPAAGGAAAKPGAKPAAKKESLELPPRPNKMAAMAALQGTRRRFMIGTIPTVAWVILAWTTFTAALVAFSAMMGRFFFPNVLAEPPSTIKVGPSSQFEPGEVNERWKAEWGFWIVRSVYNGQDMIYALSTICTHLGCPPNWLAGEQKFKCPCHGSGFYVSGINFEGPAPRPLERFKVSIGDDGQIVVDKSQKYQEELGQWTDPDSFLPV